MAASQRELETKGNQSLHCGETLAGDMDLKPQFYRVLQGQGLGEAVWNAEPGVIPGSLLLGQWAERELTRTSSLIHSIFME